MNHYAPGGFGLGIGFRSVLRMMRNQKVCLMPLFRSGGGANETVTGDEISQIRSQDSPPESSNIDNPPQSPVPRKPTPPNPPALTSAYSAVLPQTPTP